MNKNRLAIIGAGVTGLGIAKVFTDKGWSVKIYDRESEVGGTWCKKYLYGGLKLHSKTGTYLYPDFPFHDQNHDTKTERASGLEVNEYIKHYTEDNNLLNLITCDTNIDKIRYYSDSQEVQLIANGQVMEETFDFVIVTGHTTNLKMPNFENQSAFKGTVIHSSLAREEILADAIKHNKKVVVVGGNKSATDIAYYFAEQNYTNLLWLHRKVHWFMKEEKMKPCFDAVLFLVITLTLFRFGHRLPEGLCKWMCRLLAKRDIIINPKTGDSTSFLDMFHSGIMDETLYHTLQSVTDKQGEVVAFTENEAVLKSGEKIPCDMVICATGYDSSLGFPAIEQVDAQGNNQDAGIYNAEQLYRGHIHVDYPRIGFAHKRSVFFGAPSVSTVTGSWLRKFFDRVNATPQAQLREELLKALDYEKNEYPKHRLIYGEPFKGAYVQENIWFWFLYMQRLYKKDLNLSRFYFLRFIAKVLAKKTETHSVHVGS